MSSGSVNRGTLTYIRKKNIDMKQLFYMAMLAGLCLPAAMTMAKEGGKGNVSPAWVSDLGNGNYKNPVLFADYSDPDACVTPDGDFLLTASSFNYAPGLPILRSRDLVNWSFAGNALPRVEPDSCFRRPQYGKGVWAPSIRYHEGVYYIYWGDPDYGIYRIKTKDPYGQWDAPELVEAGKGMIDPTPLWDDDGRVYLVHAYAASRSGINSMLVIKELNKEGNKVISAPVMVFDGNDGKNHTIEGPKLYKRNGYYYIFSPAGGVVYGWQIVLRSRHIYGPYESKIVMHQGRTAINGPHQGAWVTTPAGEDWFLHFQDRGAYGRVLHLNPMKWKNDWPVIGVDEDGDGCGEPVLTYRKPKTEGRVAVTAPAETDEFNAPAPGLQWQWTANPHEGYGYPTSKGFFRMYAVPMAEGSTDLHTSPALLTQKFPAETFVATTKLKLTAKQEGEEAGIAVMGADNSFLSLKKQGASFVVRQVVSTTDMAGNTRQDVHPIAQIPVRYLKMPGVPDNQWQEVTFRVKVGKGAVCRFYYSTDGKAFKPAGVPFQAKKELWTGAKVGLFCLTPLHKGLRGWSDVDWFRVTAE